MSQPTTARYDGHAAWYDCWSAGAAAPVMAAARAALLELAPAPGGPALDVGCGTGLPAAAVRAAGHQVLGVDVSADQLRVARPRAGWVVRGDGGRLPVRSAGVGFAYSVLTHTDVDDVAALVAEAVRVLVPGGVFVYVGVHPCFNNPMAEPVADGVLVHAGYRTAGRTPPSRHRSGGVTHRVGVRHLPLGELLSAFLRPDVAIDRIVEHGDGDPPPLLAMRLVRRAQRAERPGGVDPE